MTAAGLATLMTGLDEKLALLRHVTNIRFTEFTDVDERRRDGLRDGPIASTTA